jgi:DNA (cytosine-5)-methyltransferase 1
MKEKTNRMKSIHVLDLFAGAGGLSYGFEQAGCEVDLAVEKDAWAVETYRLNHKNKNIIECDINELGNAFFEEYKGKIDIVMGGPPCQGFSIAASNRRKKDDERNVLYKQYLRVVDVVKPKLVLIENVKEIVNYKLPDGTKIVDDIKSYFDNNEYVYDYKILNCRNYGIPQDRRRFFFVAIRKEIHEDKFNLEELMKKFVVPEISFVEAMSDLPKVKSKEYPEEAVIEYDKEPLNEYQKYIRQGSIRLHNHIPMQHTEKTVQKFAFLLEKNGKELPEDLKPRVRGNLDEISKSTYSQNHRIIDGSKVSPTITASFYSSFVHPNQPRNLTVREAARMQTFPDTFVFKGKKTTLSKKLLAKKGIFEEIHLDQFNQVGNAVPPLMGQHLAEICIELLKGI